MNSTGLRQLVGYSSEQLRLLLRRLPLAKLDTFLQRVHGLLVRDLGRR